MKVFSQLEKAQLENTTSDTGSLPKGMITYRTDLNIPKVSNGTSMLALIDESSTQTLSNKTYASPITTGAFTMAQTTTPANPTSGNNKVYFKADGKLYTLDSAGNEAAVGSGSGGVKNLITNGNADDTASSIFIPYADAAGTRPVDGTGGSPTVTTSISSSTPLDGVKSFLLTKPASNVQGQGWAVPFTVDTAYRGKSLKISLDYILNSGTFVPGGFGVESDVIWYIYDVTNSQLIEPSNIKMFSGNTTIADKFEATFQTSVTGSSYRLIGHVQSTSASAFELKVDNVTVGPQNYVFGTPVTDWQSYTPTVSGLGAGSGTVSGRFRRSGDSLEVTIDFTKDATPGSGTTTVTFSLPSGYTIDTTKIGTTGSPPVGFASTFNLETSYNLSAVLPFSNNTAVQLTNIAAGAAYQGAQFGAAAQANLNFRVPIVGLSSSVQTSDNADTRVVAFSTNQAIASTLTASAFTKVTFGTPSIDTHGAWDSVNNRYICKVPGFYRVRGLILTAASQAFGTNSILSVNAYKNGSLSNLLGWTIGNGTYQFGAEGSAIIKLNAGDYIEIFGFQNSAGTVTLDGGSSNLSIERISGPSAIAATEAISATYGNTAGTVITGSITTLIYPTKFHDSHGAYNTSTGVFTCPAKGKYAVTANIYTAVASAVNAARIRVYKNGVMQTAGYGLRAAAVSSAISGMASVVLDCNYGDTLEIRVDRDGASETLETSSTVNTLSINRVGL